MQRQSPLLRQTRAVAVSHFGDPRLHGEILTNDVKPAKAGRPISPMLDLKRVPTDHLRTMEHAECLVEAQKNSAVVSRLQCVATVQTEFQICRGHEERKRLAGPPSIPRI